VPIWTELDIDPDLCAYCPEPATSVDHLLAVSKLGPDRGTNLLPACRSCNSSKNARPLREFLANREIRDPWLIELAIGFADWWDYMSSGRGILRPRSPEPSVSLCEILV
jgi:hypothetical protein